MNHYVRSIVGLIVCWIVHHLGGGVSGPKGHHD
jgi:hypothetical protein